jgi:hypothetical protein
MKEFKKNQDGHFICEECGKTFKALNGLSQHISFHTCHFKYYKKYLFETSDDKCVICGDPVEFISIGYGYLEICKNKKCKEKNIKNKLIKSIGVENISKLKKTKDKIKQTKLDRYGNSNYNNMEKNKQTKLDRYGNSNYNNMEKNKQTKIKKYGKNYASDHIKKGALVRKKYKNGWFDEKKMKQTMLKKYGVEHNHQDPGVMEKSLKTSFKMHNFKNSPLTYQGSYELDFLKNFYDKIDIENGPSIPYLFEGKNRVYHSDFYIPSKNLIAEIKNSYLMKSDSEKINAKKIAALNNKFNYILIVDKDYNEFIHSYLH